MLFTGLLAANIEEVSQRLSVSTQHHSEDETSEIEYPLTPPPSDVSDSRPLSPVNLQSLDLDVSILELHNTTLVERENVSGVKQRSKQRTGTAKRVLITSQGKLSRILKRLAWMKLQFMWSLGHLENPR